MELSLRALDFFKRSEFKKSIREEKEIRKIFEKQGQKITDELLHFQMIYGGFTNYAELEPIVFGILHNGKTRGAFAHNKKRLLTQECEIVAEKRLPEWVHRLYTSAEIKEFYHTEAITETRYECADTLYQGTLMINAKGNFFEDYELKCYSFDTMIESLAMNDYLKGLGGYQMVYAHKENDDWRDLTELLALNKEMNNKISSLSNEIGLSPIDGMWDEITSWYKNKDDIYVAKEGIRIRVYSRNQLNDKEKSFFHEIFGDHQQFC